MEVSGCFGLKEIVHCKEETKQDEEGECYQEYFGGNRPNKEPFVVSQIGASKKVCGFTIGGRQGNVSFIYQRGCENRDLQLTLSPRRHNAAKSVAKKVV